MEPHQLYLAIDPLCDSERSFFDGRQGESQFLTKASKQVEVDHGWLRFNS